MANHFFALYVCDHAGAQPTRSGPAAAKSMVKRQYTIPGFASLPDHSYSFWDWVTGNETCPYGVVQTSFLVDPSTCHNFETHLGAVNSSHFPPQSEATYVWYHNLALDRAQSCSQLSARLTGASIYALSKSFIDDIVKECEREALLLEAIGQHFLQDSLSLGHMWQRWGYPDVNRFYPGPGSPLEQRYRAQLVSIVAGLIHGSESITRQPDLLSAGNDPVATWLNNNTKLPAIGDLHAAELLALSQYQQQRIKLLDCSAAGLRAIYQQTSKLSTHGVLQPVALTISNPTTQCFGNYATNEAIGAAFGLNLNVAGGIQLSNPYLQSVSVPLINFAASFGSLAPATRVAIDNELRTDLILMSLNVKFAATVAPNSRSLAQQGLMTIGVPLLEAPRNGLVAQNPPAPYADPRLPWPATTGNPLHLVGATSAALALGRAFHRSHVTDWCSDAEVSIATLAQRVSDERSAKHPTGIPCAICKEFSRRHVSVAGNPSLCEVATGNPDTQVVLATAGSSDLQTAESKCGCTNELTFASDRTGRFQIWKTSASDPQHQASPVTFAGAGAQESRSPSWSSEGRIAYQFGTSGVRGIHTISTSSPGVGDTRVTFSGGDERDPA